MFWQGKLVTRPVFFQYGQIKPAQERLCLYIVPSEPPRILGVLSVDVNRDDNTNLTCIVSSYPASNISWTFKGKKIPASQKYELLDRLYTLRIKNVQFDDAGQYECTLVNELGEARSNVSLTVGCK